MVYQDHSGRRLAPGEIPSRNENPWPDIVALADPGGGAFETVLKLVALLRRPRPISMG